MKFGVISVVSDAIKFVLSSPAGIFAATWLCALSYVVLSPLLLASFEGVSLWEAFAPRDPFSLSSKEMELANSPLFHVMNFVGFAVSSILFAASTSAITQWVLAGRSPSLGTSTEEAAGTIRALGASLLTGVCIVGIAILTSIAATLVVFIFSLFGGNSTLILYGILGLVVGLPTIMIMVRLSVFLPQAVAERRVSLRATLTLTERFEWELFGSVGLIHLLIIGLGFAVYFVEAKAFSILFPEGVSAAGTGAALLIAMRTLIGWAFSCLSIGAQITVGVFAYRRLVEIKRADQQAALET